MIWRAKKRMFVFAARTDVVRHVQDRPEDLRRDVQQDTGPLMIARTGIPTLRNIETPLRTSINATSWGVDTMTEPADALQQRFTQTLWQFHTIALYELTQAELDVTSTGR